MRFFITFILFVIWTALKVFGAFHEVDKWVYDGLLQFSAPEFYKWFWIVVTLFGEWFTVVAMGVYTSFYVIRSFKGKGAALVLCLTPLFFVNPIIKAIFLMERPAGYFSLYPQPLTPTYPSGHAATSILIFFLFPLLISLAQKTKRPPFGLAFTFALLVACSRIFLGVHWTSDVVGGLVLGTVLFLVAHKMIPLVLQRKVL